jgi:hypothetical protein
MTLPVSEASIQRALVARWHLLGTPGSVLAHLANGEHRSKATAGRLKALGVLAGMPDLLCAAPGAGVFFVELKRRKGRVTAAQREMHERLRRSGADVVTLDDLDAAVELLEHRGVLRRSGGSGKIEASP